MPILLPTGPSQELDGGSEHGEKWDWRHKESGRPEAPNASGKAHIISYLLPWGISSDTLGKLVWYLLCVWKELTNGSHSPPCLCTRAFAGQGCGIPEYQSRKWFWHLLIQDSSHQPFFYRAENWGPGSWYSPKATQQNSSPWRNS